MAKLHFKYGTMNSGKSIDLMRTAYNYEEVGMDVIVMKPKIDTKNNDKLLSRTNMERKVDALIGSEDSVLEIVRDVIKKKNPKRLECILVDEAQFLTRNQVDELFFISKKLDVAVLCYGLRNNFRMEAFEGSLRLLEIADSLEELKTMCQCNKVARFVGRKVNDEFVYEGNVVEIDGANKDIEYVPMCGKCYLQKVKKIEF